MEHEGIINELQTFVEGHLRKEHLYYFAHEHRVKFDEHRVEFDGDDEKGKTDTGEVVVVHCSGCSSLIKDTEMYGCSHCKCFFHKQCAELPREIRHPSHESHPLILLQDLTQNPPLTTTLPNNKTLDSQMCFGCGLPLRGGLNTIYGCINCRFFVHKFCLELPTRLHHWRHPPHRLSLRDGTFNCGTCCRDVNTFTVRSNKRHFKIDRSSKCSDCRKYHAGFSYQCSACKLCWCTLCILSQPPTKSDEATGHILSMLPNKGASSNDCLSCGEKIGLKPYFSCTQCALVVHFDCVLPPTFTSSHHRHLLILGDNHLADEGGGGSSVSDEFYCDHCETRRYPDFPVYKCPKTKCDFKAHCYCMFLKGNLSFAHRLGNTIELDVSIVMIRNPAVTVEEIQRYSTGELQILFDNVQSFSNKYDLVFPSEVTGEFMESFKAAGDTNTIGTLDLWVKAYSNETVVEVGGRLISKKFAPVLKALFARYGDFSKKSFYSSRTRIFVYNKLCEAIYSMCNTADVDITNSLLFTWWSCFIIARFARFEIQFAVDHFKKRLSTYSGPLCTDLDVDKLDTNLAELIQQVERLDMSESECTSNHRISPVIANLSGACSGETLELQNVGEPYNSWMYYFIEAGEHVMAMANSRTIEEVDYETISLSDYLCITESVKFIFERHPDAVIFNEMVASNICSNRCKLVEWNTSFNKCTRCEKIIQSATTELPQQLTCTSGHDHNLIEIQEPPPLEDFSQEIMLFYGPSHRCFLCSLPLWGSTNTCSRHGNSSHKSCAHIPQEIQHNLHPGHPLSLVFTDSTLHDLTCFACGEKNHGSTYMCMKCNFSLEAQCLRRDFTVKSQYHEHKLTLVDHQPRNPEGRDCSRCGKPITYPHYLYCALCKFTFHSRCALPSTVTCSSHRHSLTFADSCRDDDSDEYYCDACEKRRKPDDAVYCCLECNNYAAHIVCALNRQGKW